MIEVFRVEAVGGKSETFTEALIVDYFSFTQELYRVGNIGVIHEAQDIVIGGSCLLLCCNHIRTTF